MLDISSLDPTDLEQLAHILTLALVLFGVFVANFWRDIKGMVKMLSTWGFISIGVIVGYNLWHSTVGEEKQKEAILLNKHSDTIEVSKNWNGHFYLTLHVNNTPVKFLVDTGASQIVLRKQDAAFIGIDVGALDYSGIARTANGEVRTAKIKLEETSLDGNRDKNLTAYVSEGEMETSLLGMSYLNLYNQVSFTGNKLTLKR